MQKSQAPAKQESGLQKTGDLDNAFKVAVNEQAIKYCPLEELKEVLRLIMVKVGLRAGNFPQNEEKSVLLSHIVTNYGGHTAKEILLAFEMGLNDQLSFNDGESIICYENFSCQYFSSVMNAYRRWAKEAYKMNIKQVPQIEQKEDLSDQSMRDWYYETAKQVRENKLQLEFIPVMLFDWLRGKETIPEYKEYQVEAAVRIGKMLANNIGTADGNRIYKRYKDMYKSGCFEGEYIKQIEDVAKKMTVWDHILKGLAV